METYTIKEKGLQDFLNEDKSLLEEISYEEYLKNKAASNNTDVEISVAYEAYTSALKKFGI